MSRGKQGVFTFVAALATVATMAVAPAFAATTSDGVAATDDRAPDPVSNVQRSLSGGQVTVTWDLSPSDFVRQSPAGSDFTAGGTFVNVNDVVGYNVWRAESGLDAELVGTALSGETTFTDAVPVGSVLIYSVTADDGAGNESAPGAAAPLSLGAAGEAQITPDVSAVDFGVVAIDEVVTESFVIENISTTANAGLTVALSVSGPGFAVSSSQFDIAPGASNSADVSFAAVDVGNLDGAYVGTLTIKTNDPNAGEIAIDLSADITNGLTAPDINVSALVVAFSQKQPINTTATKQITVENLGGQPLSGSLTLSGAAFATSAGSTVDLAEGESQTIEVTFTPTADGDFSGSVVIATNDPDEAVVTVSLTGRGTSDVGGTGTIPATITKATVTFTDDGLDFADPVAVDNFIAQLIQDLAALLGIDPSRITDVVITQGSIVADFTITPTDVAGEPTPVEALAELEAAVADTTVDSFPSLPPAEAIVDASVNVVLLPTSAAGEPVLGWFTRSEDLVGFNDFFAFADVFGLNSIDGGYSEVFDIAPVDAPDGTIGFDDFFTFADNFGTEVANAADIRAALGEQRDRKSVV